MYELCIYSGKLNNLCSWNNFKYCKCIRQTLFYWASLTTLPSNYLILCCSLFPASESFIMSPFFASGGHKYWNFSFSISHSKITADGDCSHEIKRHLLLERKAYDQPRQHIKKQRHYFADKGLSSQRYGFCSSHVWISELDYKQS